MAWVATKCSGSAGTRVGGMFAANSSTTITSTTSLAPWAAAYLKVEAKRVTSPTTVTLTPEVTSPTQLRTTVDTGQ